MEPCVPTYQGLSPVDFIRPARTPKDRYPFNAPACRAFYRASGAIYHLFRALLADRPRLTVLAPDYNSGNEILAMRAAGATIRYCPVNREMQLDPHDVERLCRIHQPDLLYVIHYAGWPQPMPALADLCRRREMLLVEDCALALFSELEGRPLGTFADWAVFCLYKTLPLPNGALLVENGVRLDALDRLRLRDAGAASVLGRTAELMVQRVRSNASGVGAVLQSAKRGMGRAAGALDVQRVNVGNIGFSPEEMQLGMSPVCAHLMARMDFDRIRRRRIHNYRLLAQQLHPKVTCIWPELRDGVCPLFLPVVVADKQAAARALQRRGIDAIELWNDSVEPGGQEMSDDARFLRRHVLEIPIHQDLTPRHLDHVARQVSALSLRKAA